jgi:chorismate synthase
MKNTFGNNISVTLFGESHGVAIGAVLDGFPAGIPVDEEFIRHQLSLRRPVGKISTPRQEKDEFKILSGVWNGYTTGTAITIVIENTNTRSSDYESEERAARPGHADYTAHCKYRGYEDYRGGGHFSGRITAALVAVGAIVISALRAKGITVGTHICHIHGVYDRGFDNIEEDVLSLANKEFAVLDDSAADAMKKEITEAKDDNDSVGGVLETAICGLPVGVGEPWFDSLEGVIAHALFSIPGIKGVEFGAGFSAASLYGSENNDPFAMADGKVVTVSNNCGGILGGISNGMPIIFRVAFKPTPSIYKQQQTVNLAEGTNTTLQIQGRHDPCIVPRAVPVVEAAAAIAIYDTILGGK